MERNMFSRHNQFRSYLIWTSHFLWLPSALMVHFLFSAFEISRSYVEKSIHGEILLGSYIKKWYISGKICVFIEYCYLSVENGAVHVECLVYELNTVKIVQTWNCFVFLRFCVPFVSLTPASPRLVIFSVPSRRWRITETSFHFFYLHHWSIPPSPLFRCTTHAI